MNMYVTAQGAPCAEPLREVLHKLVGIVPPDKLAPWEGLANFGEIDDDYLSYENVCDWVNRNHKRTGISWLTNGGVVDAAVLLVERALENGNLRQVDTNVKINFGWSATCDGWLDVEEDCNGDCHLLVPPASIEDFLADCGAGFDRDSFDEGCEQYCEMNLVLWMEWITVLYEPEEM